MKSSILEIWHTVLFKVGEAQSEIQESFKEHSNVAFVFTYSRSTKDRNL